jgi:hypothetical protein
MVVIPWRTSDSPLGSSQIVPSPWEWMSTNPGATASPLASISKRPGASDLPISTMRPAAMATSAPAAGAPRPSKTTPPRMTTSCSTLLRNSNAGAKMNAPAATPESRTNLLRSITP